MMKRLEDYPLFPIFSWVCIAVFAISTLLLAHKLESDAKRLEASVVPDEYLYLYEW